jgi:chemotaxis protein methyltransferase CheR
MDDQHFKQLLIRFELSWEGYRKVRKGVKKRLDRHMLRLGCRDSASYLNLMDIDEEERRACRKLLTVSISRFFRDKALWRLLETRILPRVLETSEKRVRVWSAGCACGEEAYSLNILYGEVKTQRVHLPKLEILATDLDPIYLEKARQGIYSASSLKGVPEKWLSVYFDPHTKDNFYKVSTRYRDGIEFREHDLFSDPPPGPFHIIFLRNNLLTYYQDRLKIPTLETVVKQLAPEGFLLIGSHEQMPPIDSALEPFCGCRYIFQDKSYSR